MSEKIGLCLGCMNKLDDYGRCHCCNFDNKNLSHVTPFLAPGTVLDDRYIIGKVLTYNGEGVSYISYDKVTNEKVVVREYLPDTLCRREDDSDKVIVNSECLAKYKTFMSEFAEVYKVLSRLRNLPHIVPAIDMFAQNNTTYAVLEYVEGVSLRKFLRENSGMLTWENVKKLFPPIFTTISLIHNAGIIHRGICPDNILISIKGELKLIGFSISSIRTFNTELNAELYSGYAAPEQYTSLDWQGTWTDVYSISAVLYRVLTGTVPPEAPGRSTQDTIIEPIRINPKIPPHVSQVIIQGLNVRGERRIQTITELVTKLFEQTQYVEHQKGATQTIPIAKPVSNTPINTEEVQDAKLKKMMPSIVGIGIVIVAMIIAGLLIYQIFFAPGDSNINDSGNSNSYESNSQITTPATSYSNETTPPVATTADPDDLGTGAYMPNVIGKEYEGVRTTLEKTFKITTKQDYSDQHESGIIIAQSIDPDTEYGPDKMNTLILTISQGKEKVLVPEFVGKTKKDYVSELDQLKIKYEIKESYSASVVYGNVVEISKKVGDYISIKDGEVLKITVSNGSEPEQTPDDSSDSAVVND